MYWYVTHACVRTHTENRLLQGGGRLSFVGGGYVTTESEESEYCFV